MFVKDVYRQFLEDRIAAVNGELSRIVTDDALPSRLRPVVERAIASGRRFRPVLLFVAAEGVGGKWQDAVPLSCSFELVHKASLLHDDLIDQDTHRRGAPALWTDSGAGRAIIVGDLLVGLAFSTLHRWMATSELTRGGEIASLLSRTVVDMSAGEMLDLELEEADEVQRELVERMLYLKSGSLIAACLEAGAHLGGAPRETVTHLRRYGRAVGVAFQMINDLNNVTGLDVHSKKALGGDLRRGKKTLATSALADAGVSLETLQDLPREDLAEYLEPATAALEETLAEASQVLDELPPGQMKLLFSMLIEQAREDWFWIDGDH